MLLWLSATNLVSALFPTPSQRPKCLELICNSDATNGRPRRAVLSQQSAHKLFVRLQALYLKSSSHELRLFFPNSFTLSHNLIRFGVAHAFVKIIVDHHHWRCAATSE